MDVVKGRMNIYVLDTFSFQSYCYVEVKSFRNLKFSKKSKYVTRFMQRVFLTSIKDPYVMREIFFC